MEGKGSRKKIQSNLLLSLMNFIFFNENKVEYWTKQTLHAVTLNTKKIQQVFLPHYVLFSSE